VPPGRGLIGVLHTWTRALDFHPHVHFLVPGGGLDFVNERWLHARNHFFVHVKPLAILFRAKFRAGLKQTGLYPKVPTTAWRQQWVVHSKSVGYGVKAIAYLADYLFRIGISNSRLVKLEQDELTFWYKDRKSQRRVYVTLPVFAFIRRFLQHVLPQSFVKVRSYGLYARSHRQRLALARNLLAADERTAHRAQSSAQKAPADGGHASPLPCPKCGQPLLCVQTLRPCSRSPP
jgi:Putative transposase